MRLPRSFRVLLPTFPHVEVSVFQSSSPGTKARPHRWKVHVIYHVPDVLTGEDGCFGVLDEHFCVTPPTAKKAATWVREALLRSMAHEVDEGLTVGGKRYFDPHKKRDGGSS